MAASRKFKVREPVVWLFLKSDNLEIKIFAKVDSYILLIEKLKILLHTLLIILIIL